MKNLENMNQKDLLKLVIKKLDKLAYNKTLEERLQRLETRVDILETIKVHEPFTNVPNVTWYDNETPDPTPWLPKIMGETTRKTTK